MRNEFTIQHISILDGRYIFHGGNIIIPLDDVSEQQIMDYIRSLHDQISWARAAYIAKEERSVRN